MSRPVTRNQTQRMAEMNLNLNPALSISAATAPHSSTHPPSTLQQLNVRPSESAASVSEISSIQFAASCPRTSRATPSSTTSMTPAAPLCHSAETTLYTGQRVPLTIQEMSDQVQLLLITDKSVCAFCSMQMKKGQGIMLDQCGHIFCRECLMSTIEMQEAARINCPISEETRCQGWILDGEIKALVSGEMYQKYMGRSVVLARKEMSNVFECRSTGCEGWCEFEPGSKNFPCFMCDKTNCLQCEAIHDGLDCIDYQNILEAAKSSGFETADLIEKKKNCGWEQLRCLFGNGNDEANLGSILLKLQNIELIKSTKKFDCSVCFGEIPAGEGVILQDCFHMFCCECLIGSVEHSDEPQVKCPHTDDSNNSCNNYLKPREIKALVPKAIYERHLLRSAKLAENAMANSYHCKTLDCLGWCELDVAGGNEFQPFNCPICGKNNCIKCKTIHEGVSCEDYNNRLVQNVNDELSEAAMKDKVSKGEAMRCPCCRILVEKTVGCDWIVCTACKTELCWATKGLRWGPRGKGDVTGGCKCGYANGTGVKCAPHCQNCH